MIGWAGETLVATGLLVLAVLLLRAPVARLFGARAAYALWLAPLLRLLLPPLPSNAPLAGYTITTGPADAIGQAAAGAGGVAYADLLVWAWLGGAVLFLLFHAIAHHIFLSRVLAHGRRLPIAASGPELIESDAVDGPIATGIIRRRIIVPKGLDCRLTPGQHELAIAHERLHHSRGDLVALAVSLVVLALHWFNPLAYFAHRLFRRDLEAACDAQLAARLGPDERHDYARAILGCASAPVPRAICTLTTINDLKRRLTMLQWNHGIFARVTGAGCAAALAFGGLALTAPVQAQEVESEIEKKIEIRTIGMPGGNTGLHAKIQQCDGEPIEASADGSTTDNKKTKTKILLCAKQGATSAEQAAMLEKAVSRIEAEDNLPATSKAQVIAELRAKIAALRAR